MFYLKSKSTNKVSCNPERLIDTTHLYASCIYIYIFLGTFQPLLDSNKSRHIGEGGERRDAAKLQYGLSLSTGCASSTK